MIPNKNPGRSFMKLKGMIARIVFIFLFTAGSAGVFAQGELKIAKLKYNGGGDWYANKTALPNLIAFCNENLNTRIAPVEDAVEVGSQDLFLYSYVYMTGHGN